MEKRDIYRLDDECQLRFNRLGTCFHLCTREDSPIIFHNEEEFRAAMNIVALVVALFPDISVLTFEIMSNHFHFVLAGGEGRIREWYQKLTHFLKSHPKLEKSKDIIMSLEFKLFPIRDLEYARNSIAYVNRNGFIVDYGSTPYSYPWGTNRFFFNSEAKLRHDAEKKPATMRWKREMFHSNLADNIPGFFHVDEYVSPLFFCKVEIAESLFRNAQHYFSKIARSIESSAPIAKETGESIYYLDSELYSIIAMKCSKEYGCKVPSLIAPEAKIAMAKTMRFEYNASVKQIARILKIDIATIRSLFPGV